LRENIFQLLVYITARRSQHTTQASKHEEHEGHKQDSTSTNASTNADNGKRTSTSTSAQHEEQRQEQRHNLKSNATSTKSNGNKR
jgi:hypothetical protein